MLPFLVPSQSPDFNMPPVQSKYSNQQVEEVVENILDVLHKENCSVDLALMVLGNAVSHILTDKIPAKQRQDITESFITALRSATSAKE